MRAHAQQSYTIERRNGLHRTRWKGFGFSDDLCNLSIAIVVAGWASVRAISIGTIPLCVR
jgi:hypothetical protein